MTAGFDVELIRKDFPILDRTVRGGVPLVYLDSANTSQKPRPVLDVLSEFYERHNANIHRATHALGEEATEAYEGARLKVAAFINAPSAEEVIFTKNSSEALNLVANVLSWGPRGLGPGDEVLITEMEHHSNIVPWQLLCQRTGATLRWFGVTDEGRLDLEGTDGRDGIDRLINERTKVVALVHVSNVLGTVNPVAAIAARAHEVGALVVVDASQSVPQMPVDVQALGADFVAFTGHKMLGPTGVGVLWGRRELLEELPPFLGGGEMIETVTMASSTYAALPHKYEAGTPPIAEVVMLGAAVDYLTAVGMPAVAAHEQQVTAYALDRLRDVDRLRILGPDHAVDRGGAVSFTFGDIHPHDV
ncbi:MAG: cysteine desulfurase / selenocysteine lyase, partial [Frankiales bacterium]|nr:cysteine desulfurase / selenocysteine lyase [Frankiales bacterium]